jgi:hypothetical protein
MVKDCYGATALYPCTDLKRFDKLLSSAKPQSNNRLSIGISSKQWHLELLYRCSCEPCELRPSGPGLAPAEQALAGRADGPLSCLRAVPLAVPVERSHINAH